VLRRMSSTYRKAVFIFMFVLFGFSVFHTKTAEAVTIKSLKGYQYKWKYRTEAWFDIIDFNKKTGDVIYHETNMWGQSLELGLLNSKGKKVWKKTNDNFEDITIKGNYIIYKSYDKTDYLVITFIRKTDGKIIKKLSFKPYKILHASDPKFAIDDKNNVIVSSENRIVAISYQGKKLWEKKETLPNEINIDLSFHTPIVKNGYVITAISCGYDPLCSDLDKDELMVLSSKTGKKIWSKKKAVIELFPTKNGKSIVVQESGNDMTHYTYYNIADGKKIWTISNSEPLAIFTSEPFIVSEDPKGNMYVATGDTEVDPGHFRYKTIYSINKNGKQNWVSKVSSFKDSYLSITGFSKDGKTMYLTGENAYYKLDNTTGKLVRKTPYLRKSAVKYTDYKKAPSVTITPYYILGSDQWITKKYTNIFKNVWYSRHQIYSPSGKKVGSIYYTDKVDPSKIYITTNYRVYLVDNYGMYVYYPK
jgi:hypothetical protein